MSREKQIEEMTKILVDYTKKNHIMASHAILEDYAEQLYNAGYRKQSENVIELPCKVGDTVYCIWKYSDCFAKEDIPFIQESRVSGFIIEGCVTQIIPENYGEMTDKWYLLLAVAFTKEEAEEALAKMKGGAE